MKLKPLVLLFATASMLSAASQGRGNAGGGASGAPGHGVGNNPSAAQPAPHSPASRRGADDAALPSDKPGRGNDRDDARSDSSRSAAPAARELSSSMHDINQAAFTQRRQLMDSVDMRLKSSRDSLKQIQANAKNLREDARAEFKAALEAVKTREKDLNNALKATRNAKETEWETRRSALAHAYQAHADAMARLEAIPRLPRP
jgi:hypothetical protein